MASIKVKFRPSAVAGREGKIYYQIIHERKVRLLSSAYKVLAAEWDTRRSMVRVAGDSRRRPYIIMVSDRIRRDLERFSRIECKLERSGLSYSIDDVICEFSRYSHDYTLVNYMETLIVRLRQNGKIRTSETYRATLRSFRNFLSTFGQHGLPDIGGDIMLDCLTSDVMEAYEAWHKSRGLAPNTMSFYCRILRAVYNRAVEADIIENRNPFRHVYTGVDKTVKRALPLNVIRKIKALNLLMTPALDFARDMFLMSFYLRGMSFIDMAFLKKTDLSNGMITYRRRKTGQRLIIAWTKEMQTIMDKYPENACGYLFPIIRREGLNERCAYRNMAYSINRNLKKIAYMVDTAIPLTLYVARHSWASVARAKGIPLSVISEGMGHDSETTTRIYLASLETSVVDKANSLIISSI